MIISDLPLSVNMLANPTVLASPAVGMVSYRTTWGKTQHDPASFDWGFLDQAVAQAVAHKKLISFHVAVQGFGQPHWVKNNALQFVAQDGNSIALYWDTYYQNALIAFIQAMGARYGANPSLYKTVWTIASTGGSWNVPHTETDITRLKASPYDYTTDKLVAAQEAVTTAAAAAFLHSYVQLQVGTSGQLDVTRHNAATRMAQYGYAHIPKFAMDRDGFDPSTPAPAHALASGEESGWYLLAQAIGGSLNTSGTTGSIPRGGAVFGQANWPAVDPSGQYTAASTNNFKANHGTPYTDPRPVISGTIKAAKAYGCKVLELYEQDILHHHWPK